MKMARWLTGVGSFVLFVSGILHSTGFAGLVRRIEESRMPTPLDGILKASWLLFSWQMIVLAVIAFVASRKERGGWIVLLCALATCGSGILMLRFLGPFAGVYLVGGVMLLFLIGGWLQVKETA